MAEEKPETKGESLFAKAWNGLDGVLGRVEDIVDDPFVEGAETLYDNTFKRLPEIAKHTDKALVLGLIGAFPGVALGIGGVIAASELLQYARDVDNNIANIARGIDDKLSAGSKARQQALDKYYRPNTDNRYMHLIRQEVSNQVRELQNLDEVNELFEQAHLLLAKDAFVYEPDNEAASQATQAFLNMIEEIGASNQTIEGLETALNDKVEKQNQGLIGYPNQSEAKNKLHRMIKAAADNPRGAMQLYQYLQIAKDRAMEAVQRQADQRYAELATDLLELVYNVNYDRSYSVDYVLKTMTDPATTIPEGLSTLDINANTIQGLAAKKYTGPQLELINRAAASYLQLISAHDFASTAETDTDADEEGLPAEYLRQILDAIYWTQDVNAANQPGINLTDELQEVEAARQELNELTGQIPRADMSKLIMIIANYQLQEQSSGDTTVAPLPPAR